MKRLLFALVLFVAAIAVANAAHADPWHYGGYGGWQRGHSHGYHSHYRGYSPYRTHIYRRPYHTHSYHSHSHHYPYYGQSYYGHSYYGHGWSYSGPRYRISIGF
jgi:hypothetical protein